MPYYAPIRMHEHALGNICLPVKQKNKFSSFQSVCVATIRRGSGFNVCGQKCERASESDWTYLRGQCDRGGHCGIEGSQRMTL